VDPSTLHDAIKNVIERWGFGLEVEHQTQTKVAQLKAKAKFAEEQVVELHGQLQIMESQAKKVNVKLLNCESNWSN
jgi:NAD-dependent SIR2 family protein deacetylase